MKQGEIWYADLNPTKGSEQAGLRPVVIVSGNLANAYLQTVVCIPITSKVKHYKGNLVLNPDEVNGLAHVSEVLTIHIRSISKQRLLRQIGSITPEQLQQIKTGFDELWRY